MCWSFWKCVRPSENKWNQWIAWVLHHSTLRSPYHTRLTTLGMIWVCGPLCNWVWHSCSTRYFLHCDMCLSLKKSCLLLGESGLGKSTLLNSLFLTDLYVSTPYQDASLRLSRSMEVWYICNMFQDYRFAWYNSYFYSAWIFQ